VSRAQESFDVIQRMKPRRKSPTPTMRGIQYSGTRSTRIRTMQRPMNATMSPAIISPRPEPLAMPGIVVGSVIAVKVPAIPV